MEVVNVAWGLAKGILFAAEKIYNLYKKAKHNKKLCKRLQFRVQVLMMAVKGIKEDSELPDEILMALRALQQTLENIASFIENYGSSSWWKRVLRIYKISEDFEQYNGCISAAVEDLCFLVSLKHQQDFKYYLDDNKWKRKNEKAMEEALEELKNWKVEIAVVADAVDNVGAEVRQVGNQVQQVGCTVQALQAKLEYSIQKFEDEKMLIALGIIEINPKDLKMGEQLMETNSSILFKGEYHMAPVAIKHFKSPQTYDTREVRENFQRDCKVMTKYNHANIVRIYGMCIDFIEDRSSFYIVMEYCEKGTLRDLLNNEPNLPWDTRIDMCLGASRALFRLHRTTTNPVVHQNIDSTKFLVDAYYCVKLTGFELAQTESSLRRNPKDKHVATPLAFSSPQKLKDINYKYTKECDIYSLGIVLWEIVTGKIPLQGLSLEEIQQKVCSGYQQPLPEDCPEEIKDIINKCRACDPKQRPSARVVADKLSALVDQRLKISIERLTLG